MKLLEAIDGHLGQIDIWPSYILRYIFADHPSPVASFRLKKVIAFFLGMMFLVNWLAISVRLAIGRHFDLWVNSFRNGTMYGRGRDTGLIWLSIII
jgi:hypothetical protein